MECVLDNITFHYEVCGEGTPILIMHSYSLDHRSTMAYMEPVFADKPGYRRIYLDLPGMGATKGEAWMQSSDDMLQTVCQFIDRVIPEGQFLLVGESYGGYMAQGIVYQKPDRVAGVALVCPMVQPDIAQRERAAHVVLSQDQPFLASIPEGEDKDTFMRLCVVQDRPTWERFERDILPGARLYDSAFTNRIRQRFGCSFDVRTLPTPFAQPALILLGRQDSLAGYRDQLQILEQYPRSSFAILDRAGHQLALEQQQLLTELMSEWLRRVEEN